MAFQISRPNKATRVAAIFLFIAVVGVGAGAYLVASPPGALETRQYAAEDVQKQTIVQEPVAEGTDCESNDECDDGLACTVDVCNDGYCENTESCLEGGSCNASGECEIGGESAEESKPTSEEDGIKIPAGTKTIVFTIDLGYKDDESNDDILVEIEDDNVIIKEGILISQVDGTTSELDVSSLDNGTYGFRIKPSGHLSRAIIITIKDGVNEVVVENDFVPGDMTTSADREEKGYDVISAKDVVYLRSKFATDDQLADLDGSGIVNTRDLVLLQNNLGEIGG